MLAQVKRIHLWPYTMQFSAQTKLLRYRHRRRQFYVVADAVVDVVPCIKENLFLVQFIFSPVPTTTTTTTTMSIAALNYVCLSFHLSI